MCLERITKRNPDHQSLERAGFKLEHSEELGSYFVGYRTKDTLNGHVAYEVGRDYHADRYAADGIAEDIKDEVGEEVAIQAANALMSIGHKCLSYCLCANDGQIHESGFFLFKSKKNLEGWLHPSHRPMVKVAFYDAHVIGKQLTGMLIVRNNGCLKSQEYTVAVVPWMRVLKEL